MAENRPEIVKWREEFVSQERGSRVVHYYLEDSSGDSHLAVVGTERSLRHMLYVVEEDFCEWYGSDKLGASCLKWRSRREVVDWLVSLLAEKSGAQKHTSGISHAKMEINGYHDNGGYLLKHMDKGQNSDIIWSGVSWTCGKQLRHYHAFFRNGIKIAVHSFVLVMSEEEIRYLAYLEDMYEDKKGQKKVKVRWFHQNQEFACPIPAPAPHPSEVFITPYCQVISAECVDDLATILTPEHYDKCLALQPSLAGIRLCFRQFNKNKFKFFDLKTLRGYFGQAALLCLDLCSVPEQDEKSNCILMANQSGPRRIRFVKGHRKFLKGRLGSKISGYSNHQKLFRPAYKNTGYHIPIRRPPSMKFTGQCNRSYPPFEVGDKVELLCQDSGIRGCWFMCTILQLSQKKLKVRYDDVQNVDGCGNLEEWVPTYKLAAPDRLGMRCSGRLTVRPSPTCIYSIDNVRLQNGMAVDAHWNDGWWEGVVIGIGSCRDDSLQVYLPGENIFLEFKLNDLRVSKDWVDNKWVDINANPDILSAIPLNSSKMKLTALPTFDQEPDSGFSRLANQELRDMQLNSNVDDQQVDVNVSDRPSVPLPLESGKQMNGEKQHSNGDVNEAGGNEDKALGDDNI